MHRLGERMMSVRGGALINLASIPKVHTETTCGMQNGAERCRKVQNGAERCRTVQNGPERCRRVQNGAEGCTLRQPVECRTAACQGRGIKHAPGHFGARGGRASPCPGVPNCRTEREVCCIARVLYNNGANRLKSAPTRLGCRHLGTGAWGY